MRANLIIGLFSLMSVAAAPAADAIPLHLDIGMTYLTPTSGPSTASLSLALFESAVNGWPGTFPASILATVGGPIAPGRTVFSVDLPNVDPAQLYFNGHGEFQSGPGLATTSVFVAEPPSGNVPDALADAFGPPWIALAGAQGGVLTGPLWLILGFANQVSSVEGAWDVTATPIPTPEPSSVLLLGAGLCVVSALRRRHGAKTPSRRPHAR